MRRTLLAVVASIAAVCLGLTFGLLSVKKADKVYAVVEESLEDFTINEGASIRRRDPVGLRFTVTFSEEMQAKYAELEDVECGTIMLPTVLLGNEELTLSTAHIAKAVTVNWAEEGVTYYSDLIGQNASAYPSSYYNRPISARGYMKGTKGGVEYIYYTSNTASRSMGYVAKRAAENGDESELVTSIAAQTDVTVADTLTLSYVEGGTLLDNASPTAKSLVTIGGIDVTNDVEYTIGDETVLGLENGKLKGLKAGVTSVTVNYGGESHNATVTVNDDFTPKSDYRILISSNNYAEEISAANLFQSKFEEATGVTLPIITETGGETASGKYVSIGYTEFWQNNRAATNELSTLGKTTASKLNQVGDSIYILGQDTSGTMYGVRQLLNELVGYEYYAPNAEVTSAVTAGIDLPASKDYIPDIEYNVMGALANYSESVALNGYMARKYSSGIANVGGQMLHNSTLAIPYETYGGSHLRWFATNSAGTSALTNSQGVYELCYTAHGNSTEFTALIAEAADKIVTVLQEKTNYEKVGFSIMDNSKWCQCSACAATTHSDAMIAFTNALCEKVEELLSAEEDSRADTFKIIVLAYSQTKEPPKTNKTFNKHIELWVADSRADFTVALSSGDDNTTKYYDEVLEATKQFTVYENYTKWSEYAEDSGIEVLWWTYNANMKDNLIPYNSFVSMRANYGLAKENGVDYMFNFQSQAETGWASLKTYLATKLAWNATPTDTEWNSWIDGYFTAVYGPGATNMKGVFNSYLGLSVSPWSLNGGTESGTASIYKTSKGLLTSGSFYYASSFTSFLGTINSAIEALDEEDENYQTYYDNIIRERLSVLYFLINNGYADSEFTVDGSTLNYSLAFAADAEYLGIKYWANPNDVNDVEMSTKIEEILDNIVDTTESDNVYFLASDGLATLKSGELIKNTDYTVMVNGRVSTVTCNAMGALDVTVNSAEAGKTYKAYVYDGEKVILFDNLIAITKYITSVADLRELTFQATAYNEAGLEDTTGYYVLANDIDATGQSAISATSFHSTHGFAGTFDGNGHTISNLTVSYNGIFGSMFGATVKNVNFKDVTISASGAKSGGYPALLAGYAKAITVSDVYVTYKDVSGTLQANAGLESNHVKSGLLIGRTTYDKSSFTNVTLDASGLTVGNVYGTDFQVGTNAATLTNVKIYAAGYTDKFYINADSNKDVVVADPTGVTFTTAAREEVDSVLTFEASSLSKTLALGSFSGTVYLGGDQIGSYSNGTVTLASATYPKTSSKLGAQTLTIVGNSKVYYVTANLYTMIIDSKSELTSWYTTALSNNEDGYFVLGANITYNDDYAGKNWGTLTYASAGYGWASPAKVGFKGTFDGLGHYIDGLRIVHKWTGFITLLQESGVIKNVAFKNAALNADTELGGYVTTYGAGTIENVYVQYAASSTFGGTYGGSTFMSINNAVRETYGTLTVRNSFVDASGVTAFKDNMTAQKIIGGASYATTSELIKLENVYAIIPNISGYTTANAVGNGVAAGSVYTAYANAQALATDSAAQTAINGWNSSIWVREDGVPTFKSINALWAVSHPTSGAHFTYTGADSVRDSNDYTFSVTPVGGADLYVTVNGEMVELTNNSYTVESVTEDLEIKVWVNLDEELTFELENLAPQSTTENISGTREVYLGDTLVGEYSSQTITLDSNLMPTSGALLGNKTLTVVGDGVNYNFSANLYTMIIDTAAELDQFYGVSYSKYGEDGYFVLGGNIDFSSYNNGVYLGSLTQGNANQNREAGYYAWASALTKGFKGVFDGQGYTINGLEINALYTGFITLVQSSGVIKNVGFTNSKLTSGSAGFVTLQCAGTIENVYVHYASGYQMGASSSSGTFFANIRTYENNGGIITTTVRHSVVDASGVTYVSGGLIGFSTYEGATTAVLDGVYAVGNAGFAGRTDAVRNCDNEDNVYVALAGKSAFNVAEYQTAFAEWTAEENSYWTVYNYVPEFRSGAKRTITVPAASDYYEFSGAATAAYGSDYTFTVTPTESGDYLTVSVDGTPVTLTNNSYTISNVTADHTISVAVTSYTITTPSASAYYTFTGATSILKGNDYTFTVTPTQSGDYLTVSVDGTPVTLTNNSYTISSVTANHTISVTAAIYTVTTPSVNANYTFTGATSVARGQNYTFTVTPTYDIGESYLTVKVNGSTVALTNNSYTVANVTADITVTVEIDRKSFNLDETVTLDVGSYNTADVKGRIHVSSATVKYNDSQIGDYTSGEISLTSLPSSASLLGEDKTITIYTDIADYNLKANLYTRIIKTAEELNSWQGTAKTTYGNDGYYVLGNNIYFGGAYSGIHWGNTAIGGVAGYAWATPASAGFKGTFDGKGYTIDGLTIGTSWTGFVTLLQESGVIKNVGFTDAKLTVGSTGYVTTMGIGTIENVYVKYSQIASNAMGTFMHYDNTAREVAGKYMTVKDVFVDVSAIGPTPDIGSAGLLSKVTVSSGNKTIKYTNAFAYNPNGGTSSWAQHAVAGSKSGYWTDDSTFYAYGKSNQRYSIAGVTGSINMLTDSTAQNAFAAWVAADGLWEVESGVPYFKSSSPALIGLNRTAATLNVASGITVSSVAIDGTALAAGDYAYDNGTLTFADSSVFGSRGLKSVVVTDSASVAHTYQVRVVDYAIATLDELKAWWNPTTISGSLTAGNHVYFEADIDASSYDPGSIATWSSTFNVVIDGQGHTVYGLKTSTTGLLQDLDASGIIRNIAFTGLRLNGEARIINNKLNGQIYNCYFETSSYRATNFFNQIQSSAASIKNVVVYIHDRGYDRSSQYGIMSTDNLSSTNISGLYVVNDDCTGTARPAGALSGATLYTSFAAMKAAVTSVPSGFDPYYWTINDDGLLVFKTSEFVKITANFSSSNAIDPVYIVGRSGDDFVTDATETAALGMQVYKLADISDSPYNGGANSRNVTWRTTGKDSQTNFGVKLTTSAKLFYCTTFTLKANQWYFFSIRNVDGVNRLYYSTSVDGMWCEIFEARGQSSLGSIRDAVRFSSPSATPYTIYFTDAYAVA